MELVFIFGPAAAGKLTIAREVCTRTGYGLFHNHLIVDALLGAFEFGSEPFRRLREKFWLEVFETAASTGRSLVFTFTPEQTVDPSFIEGVIETVTRFDVSVHFIELVCPIEELERRIEMPSRTEFRKLNSLVTFRQLRQAKSDSFPPIDHPRMIIDTSEYQPTEAADMIVKAVRGRLQR